MPVTPRFSLSQDDRFLYIRIVVPYVRVSAMDFTVLDGTDFSFFCKPYLLKLNLPGPVSDEGDDVEARYDPDDEHGTLTVKLNKVNRGEVFPNLDLLTVLLQPKAKPAATPRGPLIQELPDEEVAEDSAAGAGDDQEGQAGEDEEDVDLSEPQVPLPPPRMDAVAKATHSYGFAHQFIDFFRPLQEYVGILENPDPDDVPAAARAGSRVAVEDAKFDGSRYAGDMLDGTEDPVFLGAMAFEPHWVSEFGRFMASRDSAGAFGAFTKEEDMALMQLSNKLPSLDLSDEDTLFANLVTIIFGYVYDHRMVQGDAANVESPWQISTLSPVLSWLEDFASVPAAVSACMHRCLVYPYLRMWNLAQQALSDTALVFTLDRRCLLRCLLHIRQCFEKDEQRYLFNSLYINDYCCWVQVASSDKIQAVAEQLRSLCVHFTKEDIRWPLQDIEDADSDEESSSEEGTSDDDTDADSDKPDDGAAPSKRPLIQEL